jgi:hypothetical protein
MIFHFLLTLAILVIITSAIVININGRNIFLETRCLLFLCLVRFVECLVRFMLDEHLSWKSHVSHIASKISKSIYKTSFCLPKP